MTVTTGPDVGTRAPEQLERPPPEAAPQRRRRRPQGRRASGAAQRPTGSPFHTPDPSGPTQRAHADNSDRSPDPTTDDHQAPEPGSTTPSTGEVVTPTRQVLGQRHLRAAGPPCSPDPGPGLVLMMARLVQVQVLKAGRLRGSGAGESSITVPVPSLRGGILRPDGSPLALSVATDDVVADDFQVEHPVQDGGGSLAHARRAGGDVGHRAAPPFGLRGVGQTALEVHRAEDHGGCTARHHIDRRCQEGRPQRRPGLTGGRTHPCLWTGGWWARVRVSDSLAGLAPKKPSWRRRRG